MSGHDEREEGGAAARTERELPAADERREWPRTAARFGVRFGRLEDAARALRAYSVNASAGGLCIRTRRGYDVGQRVRVELDAGGERFDLQGVVAWVRDADEAIGVRFEGLADADRVRLERVLAAHGRAAPQP